MACYFPFKVDNPSFGLNSDAPAKIPVPCGKCPYCLQRRANNWVFRCIQHSKVARNSVWATLTYEEPPITSTNMMTVRKRDFQLFMKRLRKTAGKDVKYYACAEYGDTYHRPHYHAVIFNASREQIEAAWKGHKDSYDLDIPRFGLVTHCVVNGICTFDEVNERTIAYTAKYMNKGKLIPQFDGDLRTPEFQLFSKGLGINYLSDAMVEYHKADLSRLTVKVDGHTKALPRYFRLKIYSNEERLQQAEIAQAISSGLYNRQYQEYLDGRRKGQTFEEYRYAQKKAALDNFKKRLKMRKKFV